MKSCWYETFLWTTSVFIENVILRNYFLRFVSVGREQMQNVYPLLIGSDLNIGHNHFSKNKSRECLFRGNNTMCMKTFAWLTVWNWKYLYDSLLVWPVALWWRFDVFPSMHTKSISLNSKSGFNFWGDTFSHMLLSFLNFFCRAAQSSSSQNSEWLLLFQHMI